MSKAAARKNADVTASAEPMPTRGSVAREPIVYGARAPEAPSQIVRQPLPCRPH